MLDHEAKMVAAMAVLAAAERAAKNMAPRPEDTAHAMTAQEKAARSVLALVQLALSAVRVHHRHPSIAQTCVDAGTAGVSPGTPGYTDVTWSAVAGSFSDSAGDVVLRVSGCDSHTGASPAGKGPRFTVLLSGHDVDYYGADVRGAVRDVMRALINRGLSDAPPATETVTAATALIKGAVPTEHTAGPQTAPAAVDNTPAPTQAVTSPIDRARVGMIVADSVQRLKKAMEDEAAEIAEKQRVRALARSRKVAAAEAVGAAVADAVTAAGFASSVTYREVQDTALAEFTPVRAAIRVLCDADGGLRYRVRFGPTLPWSEVTEDVYAIIACCVDAIVRQVLGGGATKETV